jgi:hypothetical protein
VQQTTINGYPALSAVADYVMAGEKMVEYFNLGRWREEPHSFFDN